MRKRLLKLNWESPSNDGIMNHTFQLVEENEKEPMKIALLGDDGSTSSDTCQVVKIIRTY